MSDFLDWVMSLFSSGDKATTETPVTTASIPEAPIVVPTEQIDASTPQADTAVAPSGAAVSMQQVHQIMPALASPKLSLYYPFLAAAMTEFNINTGLRAAAFLAQLAHESGEFRYMQEIASGSAYEGREDLGNVEPGDGERFKGRGPLQLTGRDNYKSYGEALGVDLISNPTRAADPDVGFRIAGRYWSINSCNELADNQDFTTITRRINGGLNGLADRQKYYARAKVILNA